MPTVPQEDIEQVRNWLQENKKTQSDLAEMTGVNPTQITQLLDGNVGELTLMKVYRRLGMQKDEYDTLEGISLDLFTQCGVLCCLSSNGKIIMATKFVCDKLKYTQKEIQRLNLKHLAHSDSPEIGVSIKPFVGKFRTKDGDPVVFEVTPHVINNIRYAILHQPCDRALGANAEAGTHLTVHGTGVTININGGKVDIQQAGEVKK
jgi:hypothetical protein